MRTYGRIYTNRKPGPWQVIQTAPDGDNTAVWLTTLCQCLKLVLGESPFYSQYGIPSQQSVLGQVFPDYNVSLTQQQFGQYFASLTVTKQPTATPTYQINVTTFAGEPLSALVPIPQ